MFMYCPQNRENIQIIAYNFKDIYIKNSFYIYIYIYIYILDKKIIIIFFKVFKKYLFKKCGNNHF